jgi:hypothetical protein
MTTEKRWITPDINAFVENTEWLLELKRQNKSTSEMLDCVASQYELFSDEEDSNGGLTIDAYRVYTECYLNSDSNTEPFLDMDDFKRARRVSGVLETLYNETEENMEILTVRDLISYWDGNDNFQKFLDKGWRSVYKRKNKSIIKSDNVNF